MGSVSTCVRWTPENLKLSLISLGHLRPHTAHKMRMLLAVALLTAAPASALALNGRPLPALTRIGATRTAPLQRSMITPRSPAGTMTLALPALSALPACSAAGFLWVAAGGAATAVSLQLGLQAIFDRSEDPVLYKKPGVVTHSVIACMFCIFVTAIGCGMPRRPLEPRTNRQGPRQFT